VRGLDHVTEEVLIGDGGLGDGKWRGVHVRSSVATAKN
jgi:hypothetical protein